MNLYQTVCLSAGTQWAPHSRDYRIKKCKIIVLLEGVIRRGTSALGSSDRRCHLLGREEWLERVS